MQGVKVAKKNSETRKKGGYEEQKHGTWAQRGWSGYRHGFGASKRVEPVQHSIKPEEPAQPSFPILSSLSRTLFLTLVAELTGNRGRGRPEHLRCGGRP
jgi:hypothetical protein